MGASTSSFEAPCRSPQRIPPKVSAGINRGGSLVRGAGTLTGEMDAVVGILKKQRHWSQTHDGTVSRRIGIRASTDRFTRPHEIPKRGTHRVANIKAASGRTEIPLLPPAHVALDLIPKIKAAFNQACRETQRHRRIIRPLTGLEAKRTAAHHVRHGLEAAGAGKLQRSAKSIPRGESEQATGAAI